MPGRAGDRDPGVERARREMVAGQLRRRGIDDERVLEVMGTLPRELFLGERERAAAYADAAAPIDEGQTISQPYIVARMTELLRVAPGDRILEIGTGSGYQAAVLAGLGARVTSIERHERLAAAARERLERLGVTAVEVRVGDGSLGVEDAQPWDGIIVTAAAPQVPEHLRNQLGIGARLVIPVGPRNQQELLVIERTSSADWTETSDGPVVFVPLIGEEGWAEPRADAAPRNRGDPGADAAPRNRGDPSRDTEQDRWV